MSIMKFERKEYKYILTYEKYCLLKEYLKDYMEYDKAFGKYDIYNIYYDTPDYMLIRRSTEKPYYKEKLRIRSYGDVKNIDTIFIELKKKINGVVYKRRESICYGDYIKSIGTNKLSNDRGQIGNELNYVFNNYNQLEPKVFLSYKREAYYSKNTDLRVTFDRDIKFRQNDLCFDKGNDGMNIIPKENVLLEIKTKESIPLWLVRFLSINQIYKQSFSKYGMVYFNYIVPNVLRRNV